MLTHEEFVGDLRIGVRRLLKQQTYAIVTILTLAMGIGATTALWSAVYQVLLAPLPFPHADRIVSLAQYDTRTAGDSEGTSPANFLDWKERSRSFAVLAAAEPFSLDWIGPQGPEQFETALVTEGFLELQGIRPLLGSGFRPEDFQPGQEHVVLLGERLWRTRFGADSSLVGRTLVLDDLPRVVVGVMPGTVLQPFDEDVWAPKLPAPDERNQRRSAFLTVLGRLQPGVTLEQARDDMRTIAGQLSGEYPATNRNSGVAVVPLRESLVGGVRRALLVLFGAVACVLLIACVNVANLQLAESARRRRELALRTAIGAGRGRLARQLLTENVLLASLGAAAGLLVASWGVGVIRAFAPPDMWQLEGLRLSASTLLFAIALTVTVSVAIALMPMLDAGRMSPAESLASGGRSMSAGGGRRRANRVLVVAEVALSLMLLIGAGLLLRSLSSLLAVDRGFNAEQVLVTTVQAWGYYPTGPLRTEFVREAVNRLGAIPGVEAAGMTSSLPLSVPIGNERARIEIEGEPVAPADEAPEVHVAAVSPEYADVVGIPLVAGRSLGPADGAGSPPVAMVNREFARRFFGTSSPVGRRVRFGFMGPPVWREIVGVRGDVRHQALHRSPSPSVFVPHTQAPTGAIHLVVRTTGDPAALERRVRAELATMNGAMPLSGITTMESLLSDSLREREFQLALLGMFAAVALLLSAIGIYGVMSRATSERTHEIGIRMAVGARAGDIWWMVLRHGGALALGGIAAGMVGAVALTRLLEGMLFGISALDPLTFVGAMAVLLGVAVLATWLPAVRAAGVDPVTALRSD